MTPVDLAWVVPALPLLAMLLIFFVTRPLEALTSRSHEHPVAPEAHGGPGAHAAHDAGAPETHSAATQTPHAQSEEREAVQSTDQLQAAQDQPADHSAASAGGGHGEHGGSTSFWGM